MAESKAFKVGARVEVVGKGVVGTIAFIGSTLFSSGKWIGVVLDDAVGKNNGSVQGKSYFKCEDNHGIFVRQSQLKVLEEAPTSTSSAAPAAKRKPPQAASSTPGAAAKPGKPSTPQQQPPPAVAATRNVSSSGGGAGTAASSSVPAGKPVSASNGKSSVSDASSAQAPVPASSGSGTSTPGAATSAPRKSPATTTSSAATTAAPAAATAAVRGIENLDKSTDKEKASVTPSVAPPVAAAAATTTAADTTTNVTSSGKSTAGAVKTPSPTDPGGAVVDRGELDEKNTEIRNLKAEIVDLEEKLETFKIKRQEDKAKLKEFEKAKIQLQSLQEYKNRSQENHTDLMKQLQAAKKEAADIQEAFNRYKDDMSELSETIEIAALDKEMAEEKAETLQLELDQLKDQNEELTLDLELLREEVNTAGTDGAATNYQVKQLEQQNERIKQALVKMRDLSNEEKAEIQQQHKQIEKQTTQITNLTKDKEKLVKDIEDLQNQILELTEQVDCAQGAEEMVEQLTEKTLEQEEKIQELEEEKNDLEALCEMNDELQESTRETELELREEIDMAKQKLVESQRRVEALQESVTDYDNTIAKFRELVTSLQESNRELRSKQEVSSTMVKETPTIELFDFNAKFAESKAHAKAVDMEMRKLEVNEANRHVKILCSYMPDSFLKRGGDHDAVLVLLLVPRIMAKVELLISQVKEKFNVPDQIEKFHVLKSNQGEAFSFANNFIYCLSSLLSCMQQYDSALESCSVDLLLKIGTLLPELSLHEKSVDGYIDMLKKDLLDENISLEPLTKSIVYFQTLYSVHLYQEKKDSTRFMSSHTRVLLSACDCVGLDINILKHALLPGQETSDISILLRDIENVCNEVKVASRKIKRRIPQKDSSGKTTPLSFSEEVEKELVDAVDNLEKVLQTVKQASKSTLEQVALLTDCQGLQPGDVQSMLHEAADQVYNQDNRGPSDCLRESVNATNTIIKKISTAMENGEYDFDGTAKKKTQQPVVLRAQSVKAQMSDVENIKHKLEMKEEDILELKTQIKLKQEELSEQQVRMKLVEKKLENAGKDGEEKVSKLQCKLDDINITLKKKEKEYEETMDALQNDIDTLELEKTELKERLKSLSKQTLLVGLQTRQNSQTGTSVSTKDSPMLLQKIDSLKEALKHVKEENTRLLAQATKNKLADMPLLVVPRLTTKMGDSPLTSDTSSSSGVTSTAGDGTKDNSEDSDDKADIGKMSCRTNKLLKELYTLAASPKVVDISSRKPGQTPATDSMSPRSQLIQSATNLARLQSCVNDLQVKVTSVLAAHRAGGQVRTDFSTFPTPAFAKVLHEKAADSTLVATLTIPVPKGTGGKCIPVHVNTEQLRTIHSTFVQ